MTTEVHKAFVNKAHLIAIFLDIDSAYPNVHIPTLTKLPSQIDLPAHFVQFINLLFINRRIFLYSRSGVSQQNSFLGLPQGFPLSPTLFNIYALSLIPNIIEVKSVFFADYIVLFSAHKNLSIAANRTQCAINQISTNAKELNLTFSAAKSATTVFSLKPYNSSNAILTIYNNPLPIVSAVEYLRITLDPKLLWNRRKYQNSYQKLVLM